MLVKSKQEIEVQPTKIERQDIEARTSSLSPLGMHYDWLRSEKQAQIEGNG
jgi:hypothetical protein